jgi:uncharacterized membrane protein
MTALYLGIILFGGSHLFSIFFPGARDQIKARLGEKAWKGLYSIVSLIGIVLVIVGYWQSRSGPLAADWLYVPADWTRHANMLFVLLAFIFLGASHGKGYIKKWTHNPMSIGIALWSGGHLLTNGKRTDVYMFGMFFVIAVADIVMSEIRGKRPTHEPRLRSDIIAVIVGMILYVIFLFGFHPYVLNLPVAG